MSFLREAGGRLKPNSFIPEIYDAPWTGTWQLPALSKPRPHESPSANTYHNLDSPVILKLHVFSTIFPKAAAKRALIREQSPLHQIPCAYHHLIEFKFILGHPLDAYGKLDEKVEASLRAEQVAHGDLVRLGLKNGENLRDGKILEWIHAAGSGLDGGRPGWYLFKVDDDAVLNLPNFLDTLLSLDARRPIYLGTSLNRWPAYHFHFTGMVTGFSYSLQRTLAEGIGKMSCEERVRSFDDDVLTGEIMFCLPPAPHCRETELGTSASLPDYCDVHRPPLYGYLAPPPTVDPRTELVRYDFLRHMADRRFWLTGDVARHHKYFKPLEGYRREWESHVKGAMWKPPK